MKLKRPCAWCAKFSAVYTTTEYCSCACEMASFAAVETQQQINEDELEAIMNEQIGEPNVGP
jgi:hypothetical protein